MYKPKTCLTLILCEIIIIASGVSACDQQSITLQPEHISIEELNHELTIELNNRLIKDQKQGGSETPLLMTRDENSLILSGDHALINQAIALAKRLDIPTSYYLQVRNTPAETISTSSESMQILIHPEQPITLGHITLINSPWQAITKEQKKFLQLQLNAEFVLSIEIKNTQPQEVNFYSGKHPMQLNKWLMVFSDTEIKQGRKVITSKPKKQLWLRLIKANSQSLPNSR